MSLPPGLKKYLLPAIISSLLLGLIGYIIWRDASGRSNSPAPTAQSASSISIVQNGEVFVVRNDLRPIGSIKKGKNVDHLRLVRQAGTVIFMAMYQPANPESYTLFDTPAPQVVSLDILNQHTESLQRENLLVGDVSPSGQQVARPQHLSAPGARRCSGSPSVA